MNKKKSKKQSPKEKKGSKAIIVSYVLGTRTEQKAGFHWERFYSQEIIIMSEGDHLDDKNIDWTSAEHEDKFPDALALRLGQLVLGIVRTEVERNLSRKKIAQNFEIEKVPWNSRPIIVVEKISSRPRLIKEGEVITALVKINYKYETLTMPKPRK